MNTLTAPDFDFIRSFVYNRAAIVLEQGKEYLVESRLGPLAQREGFSSLEQLIAAIRSDRSLVSLQTKTVDALTTNETYFFRDQHPFDALQKHILPSLIAHRAQDRQLRIWSAACSTGQEPYTLAMIIREHFPELSSWKIEIIATDLSTAVLERAKAGIYTQLEVSRGLPASYLNKYFRSQGDAWHLKPEITSMVQFRSLNLIGAWGSMPPLDLVFLRNVMIYFDTETKKTILKKLRACMQPHGTLILGSAETTMNLDPTWVASQHGNATLYRIKAAS